MNRKKTPILGAEQALSVINSQWFILIVHALQTGERKRYSDLGRELPQISRKMLTQTLRTMERDGIVMRYLEPVVPPRTEYALTDLGKSLLGPLCSLCRWAQTNFSLVEKQRMSFNENVRTSWDKTDSLQSQNV